MGRKRKIKEQGEEIPKGCEKREEKTRKLL
jgi:hypothetical protein